jgi:hypothetical protein
MFGFGGKKKSCSPCSASQMPEQQFFPTVPTCPGETPFKANGCISNKGKFYDNILHNLIIPISGQEVKAYVCEPKLWSSCQWAAICYQNKIAIFKVLGLGSDHLILVNACQDGQPIEDNPPPGTALNEKSVIYPVPPPWCSEALCNKITNALSDPECACAGVLNCLANSEEVCLSSVPELEEGEEVHLFGGTMLTEQGNSNDDPSLWKSCLRKIKEIFTGYTGTSICFSNLPETSTSPDIVDGSPVAKRQVLLDGFGCLRKGPPVSEDACDEDLNVLAEDDEYHTGNETEEDNDDNTNEKSQTFDAFSICKDGDKRILMPERDCGVVQSFEDDDNIKRWEVAPLGGRIFLFDTMHVLTFGTNVNLKDYAKYRRWAGKCKLFAIVSAQEFISYGSSNGGTAILVANGVAIGAMHVINGGGDSFNQPNAIVPLTEDELVLSRTGTPGSGSITSTVYRLRGYMVGGGEI